MESSKDLVRDLRTYRPKYPLPEELRDINQEETFCAYCGVSYLILNEIKFLEEKSEKLKEELETVRRSAIKPCDISSNNSDILTPYGEKWTLADIKQLTHEKGELIRRLDDMNVKLVCYEASEKQFVKEISKSQAEISFIQELLIGSLDYLKQIRNRLKSNYIDKFSENSLFHSVFNGFSELRKHIAALNRTYNASIEQLNNQCDRLHNRLESIIQTKNEEVKQYAEKFDDLELKFKKERNDWSENRGQLLADILVLKAKLTEEGKRIDNLHDEKKKSTLDFEQRISQLKEQNELHSQETKALKEQIKSLNEKLSEHSEKSDLIEKNYKEKEQHLQKEIESMSNELASSNRLNNQLNSELERRRQEIFELKAIRDSQDESCRQLQLKLHEIENELNVKLHSKSTLEEEFKKVLEEKESEMEQYKNQLIQKVEQLTIQVKQKERENIVLQEEHRRIMQTMKDEINQLTDAVNNSNIVKTNLENQIEKYQKEIKQLHVTVGKECLERDELNSALTDARQQLMSLIDSSKQNTSDQKEVNEYETQKDNSLPPIVSPSKKSEQSIKRAVSNNSNVSSSNSISSKRPNQNHRHTNDSIGLAATRRQIAAIISATKFR
ncbi:unnamed protein product [Trichobilharzia szidati]|nr:unnamed protein product [Trichobilharzia szidati]